MLTTSLALLAPEASLRNVLLLHVIGAAIICGAILFHSLRSLLTPHKVRKSSIAIMVVIEIALLIAFYYVEKMK
jgi:hypothetical protein